MEISRFGLQSTREGLSLGKPGRPFQPAFAYDPVTVRRLPCRASTAPSMLCRKARRGIASKRKKLKKESEKFD